MWTRSAACRSTGLMTVVCTDWDGNEFFIGSFYSLAEAETAGQEAERRMTAAMNAPEIIPFGDIEMTDTELLAELTKMGLGA